MKNLELYVHIPFCIKKCAYCDFLSFSADENTQRKYVEAMLDEIKSYVTDCAGYQVSTIYIGGGTPSWLDENLIIKILIEIYNTFNVRSDAEITIECNPGTLTERKLKAYKNISINRLSIGLQSTKEEELKLLGRIHTYEQFLRGYELAREVGFDNINLDLMSGLPGQTGESFAETLKRVINLKPEHISSYSLIIEKGTPFYDMYKFDAVKQHAGMETEFLPSEDEEYRMYKITQMLLKEAGYMQYEISNYSKKGYECIHNIGYWTRENYIGFGIGAASLFENVRYSNTTDIYEYIKGQYHRQEEVIERKGQMEEFMFLGLRMNCGISRDAFERTFGMPIEAVYKEQIDSLKSQELMMAREGRIFLTDKGMDLSNYCMSMFLFD